MDWSSLFNSISELVVVALFLVILYYLVFSINLRLIGTNKESLVINEAIAIYLFGSFIALAIVCRPMLLALNSNLAILGTTDNIVVFQFNFYKILIILLVVTLILYLLLYSICISLFTRFTFSINELRDIKNNSRRSAIIISGLLIAVFYSCSNVIDLIFSSVFRSAGNDFIF